VTSSYGELVADGLQRLPFSRPTDIAFVMDGSESIDDTEWSSMTSFAEHVVDGFPATSVNSNIRVGLIRFSSVGVIHLPLTSNRTKIMGAIENFPKGMGLTALGRGLKAAHVCIFYTSLPVFVDFADYGLC
jgi:hypothetical protein